MQEMIHKNGIYFSSKDATALAEVLGSDRGEETLITSEDVLMLVEKPPIFVEVIYIKTLFISY